MKSKFLSLLGFAQKSNNLYSGENTCELYIKKKKIKLIIIAQDASQATKKKFTNLCISRDIPFIVFGNRSELSNAIGKINRTTFGVKNREFASKILDIYKTYLSK